MIAFIGECSFTVFTFELISSSVIISILSFNSNNLFKINSF